MAKFKGMRTMIKKSTLNGLLIGAGSVLNIFPAQTNDTFFDKVCSSDSQVLKSDWNKIGGDFNGALKKLKKK